MALRAGYYGLKRFERNKLSVLAASTPADISPDNPIAVKNDVLAAVDLLNDTVGWVGKNRIKFTATTTTTGGVTFTVNADKSISTSGTSTEEWVRFNIGRFIIPKGDYVFSGISGGTNVTYCLGIQNHAGGIDDITLYSGKMNISFNADSDISVYIVVRLADVDMSGKTFYPMITTPKEDTLDPTYEPNHDTVEEMFTNVINLALTIKTDNYTGDIDNLDAGIRYCTNAATHNPGNVWGYCITIKNPSNKIQLFIGQASTGIWYRRFASSAWQAWNAVTLTEVAATREEETKKQPKRKL